MRLVSIISSWGDTLSLLPKCIDNHLQFSDGAIVCWSTTSNYGQRDDRMMEFVATHSYCDRVIFHQIEPILRRWGHVLMNETRKRNAGIDVARMKGYTHYIMADSDEFYLPNEVKGVKELFNDGALNGLVCPVRVFVGQPTLWCEDHNTLVPFIHKLKRGTYVGNFREYPLAYTRTGAPQIDPGRRPNEVNGIKMTHLEMYHMSYIREDIDMKINNSTANLKRMERVIKEDIAHAKPGWKSGIYNKELQECENHFNI